MPSTKHFSPDIVLIIRMSEPLILDPELLVHKPGPETTGKLDAHGKENSHNTQENIIISRRRQADTHKCCAHSQTNIAEYAREKKEILLGDENDKDIGKNKGRIAGGKKIYQGIPLNKGNHIDNTYTQKNDQQNQGQKFFGGHKSHEKGAVVKSLQGALELEIHAQKQKNNQGPESIGNDPRDRPDMIGKSKRSGKIHQLIERMTQENKAKDFELLADGSGKRSGQHKNHFHNFDHKDQSENNVDGLEQIGGNMRSKKRRQESEPISLDDNE